MSVDRFEYVIHKRPNYELASTSVWAGGGAGVMLFTGTILQNPQIGAAALPLFGGMAAYRGYQAYKQHLRNRTFSPDENVEFISYKELKKLARPDALWMGKGFAWTPTQAQRLYDEFLRNPQSMQNIDVSDSTSAEGAFWLHSMGDGERNIYRNIKSFESHTLIRGTTGAGKTKQIIIIIAQLLMRKNEPTIVIDPKNDEDLRESMRRICELEGRPFLYFNPAFPEESVRIDVLKNWARVTQLSDRIKAILPSGGDSETFSNIIWNVINAIASCMVLVGEQPSIVALRKNMNQETMDELIARAIEKHASNIEKDWKDYYSAFANRNYGKSVEPRIQRVLSLIDFYKEVISIKKANLDIEELINVRLHNREHLQKLIASLFPTLSMLSSGGLDELLSPVPDPEDPRPIINTKQVVDTRACLWLGLDSLSDGTVGGMIGSIILSDLTSVAGSRYNFEGGGDFNINLVVDESSETINPPMIQLLNKSRGAGFRNFLLTQTLSDFVVKLGSQEMADQVLGNINNEVVLRVKDTKTAEHFAEGLPEVMVKRMGTQYQANVGHNPVTEIGGRYGETMQEEYLPIIPAWALRILPDFHYYGNFAGGSLIKGRLPLLKD
ncbi:MAG: conjugative transfer system coupling protein TraD [Thiomicrospira sp.]|nr:conjugative transfer system coupling protein TraD [Thiomicrospira sp.]NCN66309.1 conjugative transfer system coupling protein TraD [Thiomicrospira sp.]NCO14762.1 conjugative transfer system coupling protein TraD [Thiomicrospira sp.]NCO82359.1 conjugative transfer system coupling protein TraD [Thiomicrospira sp.]OIP95174.1 MAG: hypothetical protein AUK56_06465 [Thiomicrospira sp. CG2_30_44_34]